MLQAGAGRSSLATNAEKLPHHNSDERDFSVFEPQSISTFWVFIEPQNSFFFTYNGFSNPLFLEAFGIDERSMPSAILRMLEHPGG